MSPDYALHLAVAVRHHDCAQRTGKVGYGYLSASLVLEYVKICFLTLDCALEILSFEAGQIVLNKEISHMYKWLNLVIKNKTRKLSQFQIPMQAKAQKSISPE
jgi:hypothetical protein